jgi:hypothetical protein
VFIESAGGEQAGWNDGAVPGDHDAGADGAAVVQCEMLEIGLQAFGEQGQQPGKGGPDGTSRRIPGRPPSVESSPTSLTSIVTVRTP